VSQAASLKRALHFVLLTYALSLLLYFGFKAAGGRWNTLPAVAMAVVYMYMPALSAVVLKKLVYREPLREPLGVAFRANGIWLLAWFGPLVLALGAFGLALLLPTVHYTSDLSGLLSRIADLVPPDKLDKVREQMHAMPVHPFALAVVQSLVAGPTINTVAAFGEELGWRGFLWAELEGLGFWRAAAVIGVVWGFWHAPLILEGHNYPEHPLAGVFMMTVMTLLLSPLFAFVRVRGRSVIAAAVAHGSFNATAGLATMMLGGGDDLVIGLPGAVGFVVLFLANGALAAYLMFERSTRGPNVPR
jgi:membrane protease YdiL (CAAX protease family)